MAYSGTLGGRQQVPHKIQHGRVADDGDVRTSEGDIE